MELILEEAKRLAAEARNKWLEAMMHVAIKHYEVQAKKRLGKLAFLLDADEIHENYQEKS